MQDVDFPKPSNIFYKFLVWAYKPKLKKKEDSKEIRITGHSPLDIPGKIMVLSFITAVIIAIIIGNLCMSGLLWCSSNSLSNIEETPISLKKETTIDKIIVDMLIPHLTQRLNSADTVFRKKIATSFPKGEITIKNIAAFIKISDTITLKKEILRGPLDTITLKNEILGGPLKREGFLGYLMPSFRPISADKLADKYELFKNYNEEVGETHEDTWKRFIFISAVQSIRAKLNAGIDHPRRLLQALGGTIQWITFIIFIWCLILLVMLRIPWAKLQTRLVVEKKLPWHPEGLNVWDIQEDKEYYNELNDKKLYPRMFIPARLISSVLNTRRSTKSLSVYQIIRERIESYRNAIDIGEYEIINFLLWAVPTFGFIGTIVGIISAMENAASIFAAATPIEQSIALDKVSTSLGTAFDTSFVALVSLVLMSFCLARSRKVEANLFEELELEAVENLPFYLEENRANEKEGK